MSEIAERVKKMVVEHLGAKPATGEHRAFSMLAYVWRRTRDAGTGAAEKVVDSASFIDDLAADSLDRVELTMAFEEEFGCVISDDDAEAILTVGDAVKFLEKNASIKPS